MPTRLGPMGGGSWTRLSSQLRRPGCGTCPWSDSAPGLGPAVSSPAARPSQSRRRGRDERGSGARRRSCHRPAQVQNSPYDPEARYGKKRESHWVGYKAHCNRDLRSAVTPSPCPGHHDPRLRPRMKPPSRRFMKELGPRSAAPPDASGRCRLHRCRWVGHRP